jgi:hypothetical protein
MNAKTTLMEVNEKIGFFGKTAARTYVKGLDVNRLGKLWEWFVSEGYIKGDRSSAKAQKSSLAKQAAVQPAAPATNSSDEPIDVRYGKIDRIIAKFENGNESATPPFSAA